MGLSITTTITEQRKDPTLQLAPPEGDFPDFASLRTAFQKCLSDSQPFIDQCRLNYETRFALWNGQSADGKKHSRTGAVTKPTPWDGASDLRVYLVDEAVNSKVAMLLMAFKKANVVATPVEGNDIKRATDVANFLRWLIQTQIPQLSREMQLVSQFLQEQGIAATGQFWEVKEEKKLQDITVQQFQQATPQIDFQVVLNDTTLEDDLKAFFERTYGCTPKKAWEILTELRETGKASVAVVGKRKSYPVIRAFNFKENLFVDGSTTDLEKASAIYRLEYFTAEQLRSFVNTDGWNKDWVEDAIKTCKGRRIQLDPQIQHSPQSRSFAYFDQKLSQNPIGVVYAYRRLSDENGVGGTYLTIFTPDLSPNNDHDGFAKDGLLGYSHGNYPFTIHKREYLSRQFYDSRGLPEIGKPIQDQIKCHKDSVVDAASLAVLPPMGYPIGRPPGEWGAGARVPERRQGEYHFMDRPQPDLSTEKSQEQLQADFNRYCGFVSAEADPQFASLKNGMEVSNFLEACEDTIKQVWSLYKQYGNEQIYFRVIGSRTADPIMFKKGNEDEEYDINLSWDVQSLDTEMWMQKMKMIGEAVNTYGMNGSINMGEWLKIILETADPNIAERIIQPDSIGAQKAVAQEQSDLSQLFAGIAKNIDISAPPDIGLQVMQQWMQQPDVRQRYLADKAFAERVNTRAKQYQFQKTQKNNAQIGRLGAVQQIPDSMQQGAA